MLTGILILAIVLLLGVLTHRKNRLEEKIIKDIPLSEWLIMLVIPVFMYIGWVMVVKSILERPFVQIIPLDDLDVLAITVLFMVYGFVGNTIHFTGKILWRYLKDMKHTMAFRVNEMFHNKLGHYVGWLKSMFIFFMLPILEMNHPTEYSVLNSYLLYMIVVGVILGVSGSKGIFYADEAFGGYNKPLFFLGATLLMILIAVYKLYSLNFYYFPVNLAIMTSFICFISSFVVRQILIYSKLGKKKRLQFLAKIFSA